MSHGDLHLGIGGFIQEREESPEILIFDNGLLQPRGSAFFVIRIADG
jgi:hypothetical protein